MLNLLEHLNSIKTANEELEKLLNQSYPGTDQRLLSQALSLCDRMYSRDSYIREKVGKIRRWLIIYFDHKKCFRQEYGGENKVRYEINVLQSLINDQLDDIISRVPADD